MELWLLEVDEDNSYSYSGTVSRPVGIFDSEEEAHEEGKRLVKSGYPSYSVDKYELNKTY